MTQTTAEGPALSDRVVWPDDRTVVVDGVSLDVRDLGDRAEPGQLRLMKPRPMVDRYVRMLEDLGRPRRVVEAGIFQGGSTAFLAQLLRPEAMVAFDITPRPVALLEAFLDDHGLRSTVHTHYGVDQSDRPTLDAILDADLGPEPVDLVIDDASHLLDLTRTTFEILFPRLRPGGCYVIEDWAWGLFPFSPAPTSPSLAVLVLELLLAMPYAQDLVDDVTVNVHWAAIRRSDHPGPLRHWPLDAATSAYARGIVDGARAGAQPR